MEPTIMECVMLFAAVIGTVAGLCGLAVKAEEEKEAHRNGRF